VKKYKTIVADPPWLPSLGATWKEAVGKPRPQNVYQCLSVAEISAFKIPSENQAHLYLWCLSQHADWGFSVARAWGFDPVTMLTWIKPGLGVGRFQCNTEQIIIARKGPRQGNPFGFGGRNASATGGTAFNWARGRHSEKPAEFFKMVEKISPGPFLEMFARKPRVNWDIWGDEVVSDVIIDDRRDCGFEREIK